jgi:hypothetical protein
LLVRVRTRKDAYLSRRLRDLDADERATLGRAAAILERVLEEDGCVTAALRRAGTRWPFPITAATSRARSSPSRATGCRACAEMWLIVQLTGSGAAVGFTAGLQFVPILLFGPGAG